MRNGSGKNQYLFPAVELVGTPGYDQRSGENSGFPILNMTTSGSGQPPEKRTVQGQRRRPGSQRPTSGRAEAPKRDDRPPTSGGGFAPPPSGGYPPPPPSGGGMSGIPGGGRAAAGGGAILLALCGLIAYLIFGGGGDGGQDFLGGGDLSQQQGQTVVEELPSFAEDEPTTAPNAPTVAPSFQGATGGSLGAAASSLPAAGSSSVTPGQTWTIMLYQDADDKVLEQDIYIDFNEAERVGSTDRVKIVAQLDRYQGGFNGDGNWTDTRRCFLEQDADLERINSPCQSIGEVDMSDPRVLVDFATWAIENYPADKYVLIMSDHGMGWPGGWTDPEPRGGQGGRGIPLSQAIGDALYLHDIDSALQAIRDQSGIDALELVGMDACLMGHMEVFTALAPHARFAAASQEVEPAVGWAYTSFLGELAQNPDVTGRELGQWIVDSYIIGDQRVQDPRARQQFIGRGNVSAEALAAQLEQGVTLAAVDLGQIPSAVEGLNQFSLYLQNMNQQVVAKARNYAQPFTSIFGQNVPASYIDLAHFAALLVRESGDQQLRGVVENMFGAFENAVIAEKSGQQKPGATGISIYFPNSQLYSSPAAGPQSYIPVAARFASVSLWDDYLNFHYTGRRFQDTAASLSIPDRSVTIEAPGAGTISVSPLSVDSTTAAPGQPILMSADVDGENIGYIYLFAGFYDREANSVNVIDTDFIDSGDTREINGVYYPDWGEGPFTLEFEWDPIVFAINDGQNQVVALLEPQTYGATPEQAVYAVDGIYTFADGSESRQARALFSNEQLQQVVVFLNEGETGEPNNVTPAPREVTPAPGDQFTVYERWFDLDANGQLVDQAYETGGTLVFGDSIWKTEVLDAPIGDYTIGFIVEDLDGNRVETFTDVNVE